MKYGDDLTDQRCARCHQPFTLPMVYRDGFWFHVHCFNDGARQLRNATRLPVPRDPATGRIIPVLDGPNGSAC